MVNVTQLVNNFLIYDKENREAYQSKKKKCWIFGPKKSYIATRYSESIVGDFPKEPSIGFTYNVRRAWKSFTLSKWRADQRFDDQILAHIALKKVDGLFGYIASSNSLYFNGPCHNCSGTKSLHYKPQQFDLNGWGIKDFQKIQ